MIKNKFALMLILSVFFEFYIQNVTTVNNIKSDIDDLKKRIQKRNLKLKLRNNNDVYNSPNPSNVDQFKSGLSLNVFFEDKTKQRKHYLKILKKERQLSDNDDDNIKGNLLDQDSIKIILR